MMAGNRSWWSMHPPFSHQQPSALLSTSQSLFPSQYVPGSSSSLPFNPLPEYQQHPQSWSQLLLGELSGEEERFTPNHNFQPKKFENWEEQIINPSSRVPVIDHVKQEVSQTNLYMHEAGTEFQAAVWPQTIPVNSPRSCVTTSLTTNILDFSHTEADRNNQQNPDHSSECNSKATGGGACKKARVWPSSSGQPPLKMRKEKLGERITALHQLVSPFGKTDTASVLLEAIGYIRFLQGQIEALSFPYLTTSSATSNLRNQQCVQGDHINGAFPEDTGQLLNDTCCLKRKGAPSNEDFQDKSKDLRSRGLCLVPVSCTLHVGSDNGADYWAPATLRRGF